MRRDPEAKLAELMREVRKHRDAIAEYRLSAYPEMVHRHEQELSTAYAEIRRHCEEHGLLVPRDVPRG